MPHHMPLLAGDPRRVGRYRLIGRLAGIPSEDPIFIGAGPDGAEVAISMIGGDWAHDAAARDRFAAEAAVARRVPPFCAARVLDAGMDGAGAFLVSEYVAGQSLLELVRTEGVRRGHDLEAIAVGMATGLASVHQAGLVHGNFGPEYVILSLDGSPRVVEFGITPPYGAATPAADMLAWARTVAFAASGHPPVIMSDLDVLAEVLRQPVELCLDPEPAGRPGARAVVQSLLGDGELPAGLLAEGSRRAARPGRAGYSRYQTATAPGTGYAGRGEEPAAGRPAPRPQPPGGYQGRDGTARHGGQRPAARSVPRLSGRRTGWIAAAAIVVVALVTLVALHVFEGGRPASGSLSADTGHTKPTASPAASSPSPSQPPAIPVAFQGSWSGVVTQPPTDTYNVSVSFSGTTAQGTISYSGTDFSCSGALNLTTSSAKKLTLSQGIIQGQSDCENGQVTVTLSGKNAIWFSFRSDGPTASGRLSHTG